MTRRRMLTIAAMCVVLFASSTPSAHAWLYVVRGSAVVAPPKPCCSTSCTTSSTTTSCLHAAVGIFYGTSTGNTLDCADKLYAAFGSAVAAEPVDIDTVDAGQLSAVFGQHDALVVGTPTWNTGADTARSGTGWDDLYYGPLPAVAAVVQNKKVAVFGLGDQVSYAENYADAAGELYDVFAGLGCDMVPYAATSPVGYEHDASKSLRGDKFCGLLLDQINQDEQTDARVSAWVAQLAAGGFWRGDSGEGRARPPPGAAAAAVAAITVAADEEDDDEDGDQGLPGSVGSAAALDQIPVASSHGRTDFTPHYNPVTRRTMWTSPDGRQSYVTTE